MSVVTNILFPEINEVITEKKEIHSGPLKEHEARISAVYVGICGSDLHVLKGHHPVGKPPIVPGHEIAALVTEVGAGVTNVKPGDHVVVDPIMACMECPACKSGRFNLCIPPYVAGFRAPGVARSSQALPARNLHRAPKSLPWEVLAFAEPATCARHCVNRMPEGTLGDVLVIGAGTIGLSIIQALRIMGANKVTVIEPDENKCQLAKKYGASRTLKPGELGDESFSGVIDVVSNQATLMESCLKVKPGGTVMCMGVPAGNVEIPLPHMQRFERDLIFSGMYLPDDFDTAIQWLAEGLFDTEDLITDIFPVEKSAEAYIRAQEADSIKVLIKFSDG